MSNLQSLDEDAEIRPVEESSPNLLHCEKERRGMESLMSAGPEAFYDMVRTERCGCFLSPQEVRQITSWAQDDHRPQVQHQENGVEGSSVLDDFHSTYSPCLSNTPTPRLELGWLDRRPWVQMDRVTVHSSLLAEGKPHVREVIRWHLQNADQLIAIVTDSLTDGRIIDDLLSAASRGIAIYIILNQRSIQETVTLNRLNHPNMRIRVLGGKTFRSRTGRTVVGEMKDKFLLVDMDTVIHGNYSLTWTDAYLHQHLVTVLHGPVVESFEVEFRTLFAGSLPVSDIQRAADAHIERTDQLEDFSETFKGKLSVEPPISDPPSPPADSFLDWEAMGVFHFPEDSEQMPQLDDLLVNKHKPITDAFAENGNQYLDMKREYGNKSSLTNHALKTSTFKDLNDFHSSPVHSPTDTVTQSSETMKRLERKLDRAISSQLSMERSTILDHRPTTRVDDRAAEQTQTLDRPSFSKRSGSSIKDSIKEEESDTEESRAETRPSRKPLITSDTTRRIQGPGLFRTAPRSGVAHMSRSMMDLSALNTETNHQHEKRGFLSWFKVKGFNSGPVTPASALMQQRIIEKKTVPERTPKTFLAVTRRRNLGISADMKSQTKKQGEDENTQSMSSVKKES